MMKVPSENFTTGTLNSANEPSPLGETPLSCSIDISWLIYSSGYEVFSRCFNSLSNFREGNPLRLVGDLLVVESYSSCRVSCQRDASKRSVKSRPHLLFKVFADHERQRPLLGRSKRMRSLGILAVVGISRGVQE